MRRYLLVENKNDKPSGLTVLASADAIGVSVRKFGPGMTFTIVDKDATKAGTSKLEDEVDTT